MRPTVVFEGCAVHGLARKLCVLWIEDLIEIKKPVSAGILPEFRRTQFEITLQLLAAPSDREFQRYVVEPSAIAKAPKRSDMTVAGWRVTEYKLLGWDFHWVGTSVIDRVCAFYELICAAR